MVPHLLQFQHYIQSEDTNRIYNFYPEGYKSHQNIGNHLQDYNVTTRSQSTLKMISDEILNACISVSWNLIFQVPTAF